jgi:acyl-CoA reductase-like NAD-dependent aldehyde dehydrogenase
VTALNETTTPDAPDPYLAGSFVAGSWLTDGPTADRIGPYTRHVVSRARLATATDVEHALQYAARAAGEIEQWAPAARARVLETAAALVGEGTEHFAHLLALELGKPVKDGRGEMVRVADTFLVAAAEARQLGGEVLPTAGWARGVGSTALTYRAPVGVVLAITPFNAPANLLAHKLAASFAAGNTTIVKPPPQAPAVSAALVELLLSAGMPVEAVQLLHGGPDIGEALTSSPIVAAISFTGSVAAGTAVSRSAGPKRLMLELGGNAATVVCEDADVDAAAAICARTGFSNSGQSCISVQRVYVQASRYDDFVSALTKRVADLRVGDPLDATTDVGSMVDDVAAERVVQWAKEAVELGGSVVCGGNRDGATVAPTVVVGPPTNAKVVQEEVFGALVAVMPFNNFDEVLEECNSSRTGLQAGLFTQDISRIMQAWRRLAVGGLVVNGSSNFRLDHVPFGGVKESGIGRESPRWMMDDFTVTKTLLLRSESLWGDRE